jgi:hypothetical protein
MKRLGSTSRGKNFIFMGIVGFWLTVWFWSDRSSNKMPLAVKEAIAKAGQSYGGLDEEKSKDYVKDLVKQGRLLEECWS